MHGRYSRLKYEQPVMHCYQCRLEIPEGVYDPRKLWTSPSAFNKIYIYLQQEGIKTQVPAQGINE